MQPKSDAQLLREYAGQGAENSFGEIVNRHTNLVYSAALRQVASPEVAAEIAQSVFIGLARGARALSPRLSADASLAGWLCRSARNLSLNHRRDEFRRQTRERQAMEEFTSTPDSAPDWERLRLVLDDAMSELDEADYDALVLRYYNNQDLRSVGLALGVSDDTAQKRVSRALEKLREHLSRHKMTATGGAFALVISAYAVQAAPIGLAATISAAALGGTTAATVTTATVTKAIAMTTLQKTLIAATLAAVTGFGIYEAKQIARTRAQARSLQSLQVAGSSNYAGESELQEKIRNLQDQNTNLTLALASANADKARLEAEREQARRTAALFKELADQASAKDQNPTNDYPSARHALVGFGKLALRWARMAEQDEDKLTPEEKAANDELKLKLVVDALKLTKAANQFGLNASNPSPDVDKDPADFGACFLYGALGLNEQQFSDVYNLMQKYRQPAVQPTPDGEDPSPETQAAMKELDEQAKREVQALLTEEQAKVFELISPNLHLLDPTDGKAAFGFTLGEKDEPDEPEK